MENHELQMENKKRISLTEVVSVEGFDEENIFVNLQGDELAIGGKNLHIETLNLEDGRLVAEGEIDSLIYSGKKEKKSILARFRR